MIFIETPIFTDDVNELLSEDEYLQFQQHLASYPNAGDVIPGTGELRKIRWKVSGRGKRGGVRVIYFSVAAAFQIRLILIYRKGIKDDLSEDEKRQLRQLNQGWEHG